MQVEKEMRDAGDLIIGELSGLVKAVGEKVEEYMLQVSRFRHVST